MLGSLRKTYAIDAKELERIRRSYYSDYFSFVGSDTQGRVAFTIECNRGQEGSTWQAEHSFLLFDEHNKWLPLQGTGAYDNSNGHLEKIPDSPWFRFSSSKSGALSIESDPHNLSLIIQPHEYIVHRENGLAAMHAGSGVATLRWKDRIVEGRACHNKLYLPGINRFTRRYPTFYSNFHSLYVRLGGGGDFYAHIQDGSQLARLMGRREGFYLMDDTHRHLPDFKLFCITHEPSLGMFKWPLSWRGFLDVDGEECTIELKVIDRKNTSQWFIGGTAVGIIEGALHLPTGDQTLYGIGSFKI